ncbi:MAG: hypothetical protein HFH71_00050 [Clostridia bacterium]|nr:hypothetical protein [Clostridia bacterium]
MGVDENGETRHNNFEMDERLFRAIVCANKETIKILQQTAKKHKLKWYRKYPKNEKWLHKI